MEVVPESKFKEATSRHSDSRYHLKAASSFESKKTGNESLDSGGVVHVSRDSPIPYLVIFILMYNALHHGEGVNNQRHKLVGTPPVFYRCHLPFNFHGSQVI